MVVGRFLAIQHLLRGTSDRRSVGGSGVQCYDRRRSPRMLSLDGLEMIALLVVMALFIKVLEQFGMFEPVGGEAYK
ncbi:hypothetical protein EYF80_017949 [Liparis tanakae]|uniref:Uncharacterized protein n=1 Tax=Liparis tanakae TaxID=230148 RepID=A0A4Z2I1H9_9TELE|nr:hypothetical protein EYF80_017949 [Liparis tanakae]